MRIFNSLHEAESEIRRDISKGFLVESSRVQQRTGLTLKARERMAYLYAIEGTSIPARPIDIINFGLERGFKIFEKDSPEKLDAWMKKEIKSRLFPGGHLSDPDNTEPTEMMHPALTSTIEGEWPSYTYPERMFGAVTVLESILHADPDSRRAFWPLFDQGDAVRAKYPTRVPCSLGYQAMIRKVDNRDYLTLFYMERSCDFDTFWLTDLWFASQFQAQLAMDLKVFRGQIIHFITSFHSFDVEDQEIY